MTDIGKSLVSVIIPCYNQGKYLADAIRSVQSQSYSYIEIIVVNDGSVDETENIAASFEGITYLAQTNSGLSAARNAGIAASRGDLLVFLDADDVLYPDAIRINRELILSADCAFVSGGHIKKDVRTGAGEEEKFYVTDDHYLHLLQGNYIGMHGAVMYKRSVFEKFQFDVSLPVCEDYDLYLRIARDMSVVHHTVPVAEYRQYVESLSSDIPLMLQTVLKVLKSQKKLLRNAQEVNAYRAGINNWKGYYANKMFHLLIAKPALSAGTRKKFARALWKYRPRLYFRYLTKFGLSSKSS